jgi:hypothetical protein
MSLLRILKIPPLVLPAERFGHAAVIDGCYQLHMAQAITPTIFNAKVRSRARKGLSLENSEMGHGSERKNGSRASAFLTSAHRLVATFTGGVP